MSFLKNRAKNSFVFTSDDEQSIVAPAVTFIGLSITDNGGNTQISSAGVHGLTTGGAAGYDVYVSWAGGTGVDGFYTVLTVDDTDSVTIDLPYDAGLGTPTIAVINTKVEVARMSIPAGVFSTAGGIYESVTHFLGASGVGNKDLSVETSAGVFASLPGASINLVEGMIFQCGIATGLSGSQRRCNAGAFGFAGAVTTQGVSLNVPDIDLDMDIMVFITPLIADKYTKFTDMFFRVVKP